MKTNYFSGFASGNLQNLKISDEEFLGSANIYYEILENISECYRVYLSTLEDLSGKLEGDFAENMMNYAAVLKMMVDADVIEGEGKRIKNKMISYIDALDDADKDWY